MACIHSVNIGDWQLIRISDICLQLVLWLVCEGFARSTSIYEIIGGLRPTKSYKEYFMCSLYWYTKSCGYRGVMPIRSPNVGHGVKQAWKLSPVGNCFTISSVCGRSHLSWLPWLAATNQRDTQITTHETTTTRRAYSMLWSGLTLASANVLVKNSTCSDIYCLSYVVSE